MRTDVLAMSERPRGIIEAYVYEPSSVIEQVTMTINGFAAVVEGLVAVGSPDVKRMFAGLL